MRERESPSPDQAFLVGGTGKTRTKVDVLLGHQGTGGEGLSGRPDLRLRSLFAFVVFRHRFADELLEVERTFLHDGVHLAVDEHARVEVSLRGVTQRLVFRHDALVDVADELEIFIRRVLVAEDLVADQSPFGSAGDETLSEEEMGSVNHVLVDDFPKLCWLVNLRNIKRGVGPKVSGADSQAFFFLLGRGGTIVLYPRTLDVDTVGREVCDGGDVRMGGLAMIALVVVVSCYLPVVGGVDLPDVIEFVLVPLELSKPFLGVGTTEVFLPRYLGLLLAVEVDPDEAVDVNVDVDWEETVLGLVKARDVLVPGGFGELAVQSVRPSVVSAGEDLGGALFPVDDGVCTMSADIVEGVDVSIAVFGDDDVETSTLITQPVTSLFEPVLMCGQQPPSRKDGTSLELIHLF